MTAQRRKNEAGARMTSFSIDVDTFWESRICKLPDRKRMEVWLSPNRKLTARRESLSVRVSPPGGYSRACELAWFRADCYAALEGK